MYIYIYIYEGMEMVVNENVDKKIIIMLEVKLVVLQDTIFSRIYHHLCLMVIYLISIRSPCPYGGAEENAW